MKTTDTPKEAKKRTPTLCAADQRAVAAQVTALLGALPPIPTGAFPRLRKSQFTQGTLRWRLAYSSAGRFVVARLLLGTREVTQYWYNPRGFIVTVHLPCPWLRNHGVERPDSPTVSRARRALPDTLTNIPFERGDIRILDDATLAARGIRSDITACEQLTGREIVTFIHCLFNDNKVETLRKVGMPLDVLTSWRLGSELDKWYRQAVTLYNHRKTYDFWTWCDYMRMLASLGKDTNNPTVYLPDNLEYAHLWVTNALERQRQKLIRKQKLAMDHEAFLGITQEQRDDYQRRISRFNKIVLSDGTFRVEPLRSIDEHYEDSVRLHHCLFHNKYYEKENSIVVRITKTSNPDKPYADAEIEYRKGEILQIYGNLNLLLPEKEHYAVKTLIQENIRRFINAGKRSAAARPLLAVETFQPAFLQN